MIITEKDTTGLVNSQEFTTRRLGIKASGWSHIASILRDQLYSDKILAPIREYSTNAMDAHVEKGIKNRPIVVKLPNSLSPTFCVRDFGFGMSEDKVWDIFANYGESTKRNTNEQVGMLGIGSKSAFAYGDSFLVISFQGGFKTTYSLHVAGSKEGDIVKMGVGHTTEEDGIEVQIPVRRYDIKEFITRAEKFFKHWNVMPIFEGGTIDTSPVEKLCHGESWFVPTKGVSSVVIMGNIAYDLDRYSIKFSQNGVNTDEENNLVRLFNTGASFIVPIGSVDVAASREKLQYTDKTIKAIIAALRNTFKEIVDMVIEHFNKCKTLFEKKCLYAKYNEYDSPMYHLNYITNTVCKFKNFTSYFNTQADQSETRHGFKVRSFAKSHRGNRKVRDTRRNEYQINCRSNIQYIRLESADLRPLDRISVLMERDNNTFGKKFSLVYTIEVTNKSLFDEWVKANQFDIPLIQFASLPIVKTNELYPSSARAKTSYVGNVKNGKKILTVDFTGGRRGNRYASDSDCFKIAPLVYPTDGGVKIPYIVIDRYRVSTGTGSKSGHSFVSECNLMMKMLNFTLPTVVAVRSSEVNKLDNKKFVPFSSFITDVILANPVMVQSVVNDYFSVNYSIKLGDGHQIGRSLLDLMVKKIDLISNKTNVAYLFLTNLKSMSKISNSSTNNDAYECVSFIKNYTTLNITKMVDSVMGPLIVEGNKFVNTYPMIKIMNWYRAEHSSTDPKIQNILFEYLNFVDAHRKPANV